MFVIDDEAHAELQDGRFQTVEQAMAELARKSLIAWDEAPNRAPCAGWQKCGRRYELVEYDDSTLPWKELSRRPMLNVSAAGVEWLTDKV
jgi:hypothetical protein